MNKTGNFYKEEHLLFVSDVHLGGYSSPANRKLEQDFIALIDYAEAEELQIFFLGDIFDYWMEYGGYAPKPAPDALNRLIEYNERFGPSLYITGNHDCWTGPKLASCGFEIEREYRLIELDGIQVLMLHGDGLSDPEMNLPRPLFHRLLRNRYFLNLYQRLLPPRAGVELTGLYSRFSRLKNITNRRGDSNLDAWAREHLQEGKADVIICGHHHLPRFQSFKSKTYINLGSFSENRLACLYTNHRFHLVKWDGLARRFITQQSTTVFKDERQPST